MKQLILFLTIFFFLPCCMLRAEEITLTLDEAVAIALRDNRDILLKTEDLKKATQKLREAQSGLSPTVNFSGGWTQTRDYYPKNIGQTSTQTTVKQYLYKGGKIINTIQMNNYKLEVAKASLDAAKLETILNVEKAFYTLMLAGELTNLNKSILLNTQKHLASLKERYKNGEASESDILQVEASSETVGQAYEASLNDLQTGKILLADLLYLDKDVKINPDAKFKYEPREIAIEEAILKAMKARPEIKQYDYQENADKKAIEVAKSDSRPSIYASWDYYTRSTTSLTFTPSKAWNDNSVIGFTFSWPVFDGFATKAKVEQAIVDLKETKLTREKIIRDIRSELKNAYLSFKNALAKISATQADLSFYRNNLKTIEEKYHEGIASLLDMNDAWLKFKISSFNRKQSLYDYIIAQSNFNKAMGGF